MIANRLLTAAARATRFAIAVLALATAGAPHARAEYRLGTLDRVKVKVHEWPDVTGEYTVNDMGMVSLPVLGDIPAAGLDVEELARNISARLGERSGGAEKPLAAVEITQFRPFFIVGDVEKPGEYPYRPGLTILQAIAIAGGYYRPPGRDVAVARGDSDSLSAKLLRLVAREARLAAAVANAL